MQPIAFCYRCRGMRVGWNQRYILHCLMCKEWISKSSKLLILTVLLSIIAFTFQTPGSFVFSDFNLDEAQTPVLAAGVVPIPSPAVTAMEEFLEKYNIAGANRGRVARAIIHSSRKHDLDPRLVASIMIVESRANPFAISEADSVGMMQIHLKTWGEKAVVEGVNLFKIEDNIDFGVRILKDYVKRVGMWQGVKRYKGWNSEIPNSNQNAEDYVQRVRSFYEYERNPTSPTQVLQ